MYLLMLADAPWYETAGGIVALITGLFGLIGTAVGAVLAIRNFVKVLKTKSLQEIWAMIMKAADDAMKVAEQSDKAGADKKQMAMDLVKQTCLSMGLDISMFIDQLSAYIDQSITFVNDMK